MASWRHDGQLLLLQPKIKRKNMAPRFDELPADRSVPRLCRSVLIKQYTSFITWAWHRKLCPYSFHMYSLFPPRRNHLLRKWSLFPPRRISKLSSSHALVPPRDSFQVLPLFPPLIDLARQSPPDQSVTTAWCLLFEQGQVFFFAVRAKTSWWSPFVVVCLLTFFNPFTS